jgi:hypothetical protein
MLSFFPLGIIMEILYILICTILEHDGLKVDVFIVNGVTYIWASSRVP